LFELYQEVAKRYQRPSLVYERKLIALAKRGNPKAKEELLFLQIGFFLFRIRTILFPSLLKQYGEDKNITKVNK